MNSENLEFEPSSTKFTQHGDVVFTVFKRWRQENQKFVVIDR